jgi:neutral ceramidase
MMLFFEEGMAKTEYKLRAGAGRGVILYPPAVFPLEEGYTAVHDDPGLRILLMECEDRFALVSVEAVGLPEDLSDLFRDLLEEKAGVPRGNIWLSSTHSVSTPHLWPIESIKTESEIYKRKLMAKATETAFIEALGKAIASVRDACFGYGEGVCAANVNRVIETRDGWWLGSGEEGPADRTVAVLRFDGTDGEPIAILYNYATELAVMDKSIMSDGGRHVTADMAGVASRFVEREFDDKTVAIFCPGVYTDQGPAYRAKRTVRGRSGAYREIDIHEKGYLLMELLGERLGEQALVAAERIHCAPLTAPIRMYHRIFPFQGQQITDIHSISPAKAWEYIPTGEVTSPVEVLIIGNTALIGLGGVGCRTAKAIKEQAPFAHAIVVFSVRGASTRLPNRGMKYMVEKDLYEKITFQSRDSGFAAGSGEKMLGYVTEFLNEIKRKDADPDLMAKDE